MADLQIKNMYVLLALILVLIAGAFELKITDDAAKGVVSRDANKLSQAVWWLNLFITVGSALGILVLSYKSYRDNSWTSNYDGVF